MILLAVLLVLFGIFGVTWVVIRIVEYLWSIEWRRK